MAHRERRTPRLLVALVAWCVAGPAYAQETPPPAPAPDEESATVEADARSEELRRRLMAPRELEWIESLLRDPDQLERTAPDEAAAMPAAQVRERLLSRRKELLDQLAKTPPEPLTEWRSEEPRGPVARRALEVLRALREDGRGPDRADLRALLDASSEQTSRAQTRQQQEDCRWLSFGIARASAFRLYRWAPPRNASGRMAFWPLSDLSTLPNTTPMTGWRDEVGANFWGWLVKGWDIYDIASMAEAAVLQFQFPPPPCPATLCWGTTARAEAPTPWTLAAGWARIDTDWLVQEAPTGQGFPPSIRSYRFLAQGLWRDTRGTNLSSNELDLDGCFTVPAGVRSRVHLGASLMIMSTQGRASTIDIGGLGDHFRFGDGVVFVMAGQ